MRRGRQPPQLVFELSCDLRRGGDGNASADDGPGSALLFCSAANGPACLGAKAQLQDSNAQQYAGALEHRQAGRQRNARLPRTSSRALAALSVGNPLHGLNFSTGADARAQQPAEQQQPGTSVRLAAISARLTKITGLKVWRGLLHLRIA